MKKYHCLKQPKGRAGLQTLGPLATFSLLMTGLIAAPGCGGGGSASSVTSVTSVTSTPSSNGPSVGAGIGVGVGRATFTVNWPAPSRLIPSAAKSILVRITSTEGAPLAEQRM